MKTIKQLLFLIVILILSSCKPKQSATIGWQYDLPENEDTDISNNRQYIPNDMVFVKGGTYLSKKYKSSKESSITSYLIGKHEEASFKRSKKGNKTKCPENVKLERFIL